MAIIYLVLFPGLVWVLPGWLVSRWLIPRAAPVERLATSLLLGIISVPPLCYAIVYFGRTPLTPWLIGAVAAAVGAAGLALRRWAPRPMAGRAEGPGWLVAAVLVLAAVAATIITVPRAYRSHELFSVCLHESCLIMLEDGSGAGLATFDPALGGTVVHATARPRESSGYGLAHILGHQRPGSMAIMAQGVAFHGAGGLVVMAFVYRLLVVLMAALLASRVTRHGPAIAVIGVISLLGAQEVAGYAVNENMVGFGLAMGVLYLGLRARGPWDAVAACAALALCFALRPVTLSFLPGLLVLLPWRRPVLLAGAIALGVAILPWLMTNLDVYEHLVFHPSLMHAATKQELLGIAFSFHPLNWPVAETVLRAPFEPFPNLVALPLAHQRAFGALFWVIACLGATTLKGRTLAGALLMAAPNYMMLLMIVSLDGPKLSYALLSFAPLPLLVGAGVTALAERKAISWQRRMTAAGVALAGLVALPWWAGQATFAPDPRPQYHTERDPASSDPDWIDTERVRLLTRRWLPDPSLARANPSLIGELLWYGGPPQRDPAPAAAPAVLWLDHSGVEIHAELALLPGSALSELVGDTDRGCTASRLFAAASLYLERSSPTVRLVAMVDKGVLTIDLDTGGGTGDRRGYLTLGLHNDQLDELRDIRLRIDGAPVVTHLIVRELPGSGTIERLVRVVSNYPWHVEWDQGTAIPRPGARQSDACERYEVEGGTLGVSRQAILLDTGHERCRFLAVTALDEPAQEACPWTRLNPPATAGTR